MHEVVEKGAYGIKRVEKGRPYLNQIRVVGAPKPNFSFIGQGMNE